MSIPAATRRQWVVGFLFDEDADRVVLIRKNRPEWQRGRLNGVGGKVEPGEVIYEAMEREFLEETGVRVPAWQHFCTLTWEEGVVHFLRAFVPAFILDACHTVTDEPVELRRVHELLTSHGRRSVTPNLLWLVPLAAHRHDDYDVIDVVETGTTLRKPGRLDVVSSVSRLTGEIAPVGATCDVCGLAVGGWAVGVTRGDKRTWDRPSYQADEAGKRTTSGGLTHVEGGARCVPSVLVDLAEPEPAPEADRVVAIGAARAVLAASGAV